MLRRTVLFVALAAISTAVLAQTQVRGYTRKDGTYVQPHVRSSQNKTKADNYGPSRPAATQSSPYSSHYAPATYQSPYSRDKDKDGVSNQHDYDDDNDGVSDDYDSTP